MSCNAVVYPTVDRGRKNPKIPTNLSRLFLNEGRSCLCHQERQLYPSPLSAYVLLFSLTPMAALTPSEFSKSSSCHISSRSYFSPAEKYPWENIDSIFTLFSVFEREEGGGGEGAPLMCLRRAEALAVVTVCMFTLVENEANFCCIIQR
jgi:hypothetical protein